MTDPGLSQVIGGFGELERTGLVVARKWFEMSRLTVGHDLLVNIQERTSVEDDDSLPGRDHINLKRCANSSECQCQCQCQTNKKKRGFPFC